MLKVYRVDIVMIFCYKCFMFFEVYEVSRDFLEGETKVLVIENDSLKLLTVTKSVTTQIQDSKKPAKKRALRLNNGA